MALESTVVSWDKDLPLYLQKGPVLFPEQAALCLEAVDLLEKARKRDAEMMKAAEEEFERQKALGYEQGLKEGREAAAAHNIKTVLASIDYFENSRQQIIKIVIDSLRHFVMELPPEERIYQLVGQALTAFKQQPRVTLQINSEDREAVENVLARLQKLMPAGTKIEVRIHEDLSPGTCVLESPLGLIDSSLESQLAILEKSLMEATRTS